MTIHPLILAGAAALLLGAGPAAQEAPPDEDSANEISVHGDIPHCHKRPGDPLDAVDVSSGPSTYNTVVEADAKGVFHLVPDHDPITGPVAWQRAGTQISAYLFRVPTDNSPLCIGSKGHGAGNSFGQLRRVIDARPLWGKYVRFTAFFATRKWNSARAWLGAWTPSRYVLVAGDHESVSLDGTGQWAPLSITMGPIPVTAGRISYGFLLQGKGDLWILNPQIEVLDQKPADVTRRKWN